MICIIMNYKRICPDCNKGIIHSGKYAKDNCNRSIKRNLPCVSCGRIRMKNNPNYWNKIEEVKKILSKKLSGELNPNYKVPMSEEQKEKIRKNAKVLKGKDNLSYRKSFYTWWVEKYGKEEADKKLLDFKKKHSESSSGKNNPMHGKPSPQGSGNGWSGWYNNWYFRSLHELSYMIRVIERFNLLWESGEKQNYSISYTNYDGKEKTYFSDFIINGKYMIECKPKKLHKTPSVKLKKEAAEKFCVLRGLKYKLVSPRLLCYDVMVKLWKDGKIKFLEKYERKFREYKP